MAKSDKSKLLTIKFEVEIVGEAKTYLFTITLVI